MTIIPPTDRVGIKLECGQRVRAVVPWGEVQGVIVALRAAVGTVPAWVSVLRPGEWNEVQAMAGECEILG